MSDIVRPLSAVWSGEIHKDRCRGARVRDHLDTGPAIPLISLEFNLPHFEQSLRRILEKIEAVSSRYRYNLAIMEPPLEFDEWLTAAESLAEIKRRGWFYVGLYARL